VKCISTKLGAKVIRLNKNTKARTLATNTIKTFRYKLIASSVKLKLH